MVPNAAESTCQAPRMNVVRERCPNVAEQVAFGNHVCPLVCSVGSDVHVADVQVADVHDAQWLELKVQSFAHQEAVQRSSW